MSQPGLDVVSGALVMVTTMMGSGVIMMPCAINDLGYRDGTIGLGFIGLCSFFTLYAISYAAYHFAEQQKRIKEQELYADPSLAKTDGRVTYYNVAASHSRVLALFVDIFMISQGVGSCICYLGALKQWVPQLLGKTISKAVLVPALILPLSGLALLKNLSSLKYASYLSVSSVFYLMGLCLYYCFTVWGVDRKILGTTPLQASNNVYYTGLSKIIFAIGCHQNIVQVFSELKKPGLKEITLVSAICILVGGMIYLAVGLAGYYVGGHGIKDAIFDVFNNSKKLKGYLRDNTWDKEGYLIKGGMLAFVLVMFCAFPMQLHPARDAFANVLMIHKGMKDKITKNMDLYKSIITIVFCLSVGIVGCLEFEFGTVINIIGATATNGLTYFIPAVVFIMAMRKMNALTVFGGLIAGLSVFLMFYMLYMLKN